MLPPAGRPRVLALLALLSAATVSSAAGRDWIHWRGPEQTGQSREKNLPADFDPSQKAKGNVVWQQPYGGRSSPLVLDGRAYIIQGAGDGVNEGEQVLCVDAETGKLIKGYKFNVFHTDIVSVRLGWTTLTADPATKYVYAHATGGILYCFDRDLNVVWQRSLTEEYGRVTGYGGRIVSPIFDSGLVIVGMINASWGDQAPGNNRFVAFDGKTGEVVWWASTGNPIKGTYYSNPIVAVVNGQRLLVTGGGDGWAHAFNLRTGQTVWTYRFSAGVANPSPVADGNLVYLAHGEENPEGGPIGRLVCVDMSQVDPKTKAPKVVWDTYGRKYKKNRNQPLAARFGLASPALADGKLYIPDDGGDLYAFNAKTGEMLWKYRYATEVRGSPLVADGKIYIFDVKSRISIITLDGDKEPDPDSGDVFEYKFPGKGGVLSETNGTPIAVNNKVYFNTRNEMFCLGIPGAKDECGTYKPLADETPFNPAAAPSGVRIFPADLTARPGEKVALRALPLDANGRVLDGKLANAEWSLPLPPKAPTGAQPPALAGMIEGTGESATFTPAKLPPTQNGYVDVTADKLKARARVRVAGGVPYSQDFTNVPVGVSPGGWLNAQGKYRVVERDGNKVLSKINTDSRPPLARANAYMTLPTATGYAVQSDILMTLVRGKTPDAGVVANRYTLIMDGKVDTDSGKRQLRLVSWEARPRINVGIDYDWQPDTWYTVKLAVDQGEKTAVVRGKIWKQGDKEPEKWSLEFEDTSPNREGSAALYGYVPNVLNTDEGAQPGSDIFYDNVKVTANPKK